MQLQWGSLSTHKEYLAVSGNNYESDWIQAGFSVSG